MTNTKKKGADVMPKIKKVSTHRIPVEAVQFCTHDDGVFIIEWMSKNQIKYEDVYDEKTGKLVYINIKTPEGWLRAHRGSWVFMTPLKTFYTLNNDSFEAYFDA